MEFRIIEVDFICILTKQSETKRIKRRYIYPADLVGKPVGAVFTVENFGGIVNYENRLEIVGYDFERIYCRLDTIKDSELQRDKTELLIIQSTKHSA